MTGAWAFFACDGSPNIGKYLRQSGTMLCRQPENTLEFLSETVGILQSELRLAHATHAVDGADATLAVLPRVPDVLTQERNLLFPSGEEVVLGEVDLEHDAWLDIGGLGGCIFPQGSDSATNLGSFHSCQLLKLVNTAVNLCFCILELLVHRFPSDSI